MILQTLSYIEWNTLDSKPILEICVCERIFMREVFMLEQNISNLARSFRPHNFTQTFKDTLMTLHISLPNDTMDGFEN